MLNLDDLSDEQQERMCVLCEDFICGSRCDSKGNMCEGIWCDQAIEYLSEEVEEQNREIVNRYFKNK
jgi:hypothetical protein